MRFIVPKGSHRIEAEFRETIPRFMSTIVSFIAFILVCSAALFPQAVRYMQRAGVLLFLASPPSESEKKKKRKKK
jgi:hypothetical protein